MTMQEKSLLLPFLDVKTLSMVYGVQLQNNLEKENFLKIIIAPSAHREKVLG